MEEKTGRRHTRRFPEKQTKPAMKFNPEAAVFAPGASFPNPPPVETNAKKTKAASAEEDIGCFFCDDGWWCPFCSKSDDLSASTTTTATASKMTETSATSKAMEKVDSNQLPEHTTPKKPTQKGARRKFTAPAVAVDSDPLPPKQYGLGTRTLPFGLMPEDFVDNDILPPKKRGEVSLFPLAPGHEREMATAEGKSWSNEFTSQAPTEDGEVRTEKKTGDNWPAVERRIKKWRVDVEAVGSRQDEALARFLDR